MAAPDHTLADLAQKMKNIDFAILSTITGKSKIAGRPMSNNREVDYDGDSYYFTEQDARMVSDIEDNPHVGLSFQDKASSIYITVEGKADVVRDKAKFARHWSRDNDTWFPAGPETEGLVMIHVKAKRLHYWDGENEGEVKVH